LSDGRFCSRPDVDGDRRRRVEEDVKVEPAPSCAADPSGTDFVSTVETACAPSASFAFSVARG
jgi:hypothetical protein